MSTRVLGTNLNADAEAAVGRQVYLVEIGVGGTLRLATNGDAAGNDIVWNGHTWLRAPVKVGQLRMDSPLSDGFRLTVQSIDPNLISTYTSIEPSDTISLFETAKLSSYAGSNDVVPVYSGTVNGGWRLREATLELEVVRTLSFFPPYYCRPADGFTDLTLPGVYPGLAQGPIVLKRGV